MTNAITVSGLGKKYILRHQNEGQRYVALRDLMAQKMRSLFRPDPASSATREEFWAIKDVNFEIKQGEAVGIIGRNGAGKSTLLKLLSRISKPTTGRIEINGRVACLLEVGTGFHPELTGRENIYLNGAIMGMARSEIKKNFDAIVDFAEVERFLDTPVKRYSSGMYMRLAFAVSAHLEPEILIVDEVLAVGDASFQKKCLGKMQDVSQRDGRTVLFVSHNMSAVQQLCERGIMLEGGSVVESGPIEQVVQRYLQTAASTVSVVELADLKRRWDRDERIKLLRLEINQGESLLFGEPCEFGLTFETRAPLEDLSFELGFSGLDGVRFLSYDSAIAGLQSAFPKGVFQLRFRIEKLPVQAAFYTLDVGVHSGGANLDYLMGATQVEVQPSRWSPKYRTGGAYGISLGGDWRVSG